MDFIDNTLDYIKSTLDVIKSGIMTTKDVLISVGNIIGTITDILGFIGFRVFVLLLTTTFILWLLNLVSPISKKTNYVIAISLVLWIAITARMPIELVILKYIVIILSPFVITYFANFIIKYTKILYFLISSKINYYILKINYDFIKNNKFKLNKNDEISLLVSSDFPTLKEIQKAKSFLFSIGYKIKVIEGEKIFFNDKNEKIFFSNELKYNQLIKSIKSKNIKLLWFWSQHFESDKLLFLLSKTKRIKQKKLIIGSGDNSFILNFLQEKWNWKVVYGSNLKNFINNYYSIFNDKAELNEIFNIKYNLSLINDYDLKDNYILKGKMIGGELNTIIDGISTENQMNFNNKILFLNVEIININILYELISHLQNFILFNNIVPKALVFNNLYSKDNLDILNVLNYFSQILKDNNIKIPFFKIIEPSFTVLNKTYIIEYKNESIVINDYS